MQKLQNMKIRIKDPEHSKQVQECLMALGHNRWMHSRHDGEDYKAFAIYVHEDGDYVLSRCNECSEYYFTGHYFQEVTLEDLQRFVEAKVLVDSYSATADIPTFSVDNTINTYMSQIQKQLVDTNLVIKIYKDKIHVANMHDNDKAVVQSWDEVLEAIKVKQAYLDVFKGS